MGLVASVWQPSTLRMMIWPEASKAQNKMAAVSADGSLLSSIVKNIKRVMAAEYSRELSVKVHTGQSRIAGLGYRVGGPLTFGLRRELVDETHGSKGQLTKGNESPFKRIGSGSSRGPTRRQRRGGSWLSRPRS